MKKLKTANEETYKTLTTQKNDLQEEIDKLNTFLDGKSNPEVAKKLNNIELEKSKLSREQENLENKLTSVKSGLEKLNSTIASTSQGKKKELIEAVKKQRWYFIKNKKEILFDSHSGYLWANLDFFNHIGNLDGAKEKIKNLKLSDIDKWKLPSWNEIYKMINDKTFPFQKGREYQISSYKLINAYNGPQYYLDSNYIGSGNAVTFSYPEAITVPCNPKFASKDFHTTQKVFTADERAEKVLNLFAEQKWLPKFDEPKYTDIFEKLYFVRPEFIAKYGELETKLKELEPKRRKLSAEFDFKVLLEEYNLPEINNSYVEYAKNLLEWFDELLLMIDDYQKDKQDMLLAANKVREIIAKPFNDLAHFGEQEKGYFTTVQEFNKKHFNFGFETLYKQLMTLKTEALALQDDLDKANNSDNRLQALYEIENKKRPSFYFMAENSGNLIKSKLIEMEWFEDYQSLIFQLLEMENQWIEDYDVFTDKSQDDFLARAKKESIEKEQAVLWFADWRKERFLIISKLLPLVKASINQTITPQSAADLIDAMVEYREKLDKFYEDERLSIHQKFAFQPKGELQEKFEKEMELSKITNTFISGLESVIFKLDNSAAKIFVAKWAEDWLTEQITEIVQYAENQKNFDLSKEFSAVLEDFRKLNKSNLDQFLLDAKAFSEFIKDRNDDYNSLMFRMRKEIGKV